MHVLIVLAHPEPTSFSAALCRRGTEALEAAGHTVTISDLHAQTFNPVAGRHDFTDANDPARFHYQSEQARAVRAGTFAPDLAAEQAKVAQADLLVLLFPLWWGGVPAILKGWFERVLAYGFAYADGLRFDQGVFRGRRAMIGMTTGGPPVRFGPGSVYGEVETQVLWQAQHLVLEYMGYDAEPPFIAYSAPRVTDEVRQGYLDDFAVRIVAAAGKPVDRSLGIDNPLERVPGAAWSANR